MLTCHQTTEEEKYLLSAWEYPGEYAVYNSAPYEEQKRTGGSFANPQNQFYSFYDGTRLVGYVNLREKENGLFLGMGVHPDTCSRGYGRQIIHIAYEIAQKQFRHTQLHLIVRAWNTRAVRCYEKAGFRMEGAPFCQTTPSGEDTFYHMIKEK